MPVTCTTQRGLIQALGNMIKLSSLLFLLALASHPIFQEKPSLDLWTGTIEIHNNVLYLKRCDISQQLYRLEPLSNKVTLSEIPQERIRKGEKINATVIEQYQGRNDEHLLLVDHIDEVVTSKSCYLSDI